MAKIFPNLGKDINMHIPEARNPPINFNPKEISPKHIRNCQKLKTERIWKA